MHVEEDKNHVEEVWSQSEQDLEAQSVKKTRKFTSAKNRPVYLFGPTGRFLPTHTDWSVKASRTVAKNRPVG